MHAKAGHFQRSLTALLLILVAMPGCAGEKVYRGDPSKWPAPDDTYEQPVPPYSMSVERLFEFTDKGFGASPPMPTWSKDLNLRVAREQAQMYIAAVLDAGEGRDWCVSDYNVPPHEVDQTLLDMLRAAKSEGNAAIALQHAAKEKYPCHRQEAR